MTTTTGASTAAASAPDHKATAEKLLTAANDGAKSLKALFFWYVGALAYAVISVAGVTDEQLLKASPLKLPILSVDIPLVEYFAILPLVVVLIHLELLVQFALLSNKVNDFKNGLRHLAADEASDFRLRLENFMLSHLLAGRHHAILHTLLFLLIQGALVALPLFTLLTIQAQFLAYHSEPMMWWHRILVLTDAVALLYFWPNLFHREDMKAADWLKLMAFRVLPRVIAFLMLLAAIYALLAWFRWPLAEIGVVLGLVLIAAIVFSLRASPWRRGQCVIYAAGHHLARWALVPLYIAAMLAVAYWIDRAWNAHEVPLATIGAGAAIIGGIAIARRRQPSDSLSAMWTNAGRWAGRSHDLGLRRDAPGMSAFGAQCVLALVASGWLLSIPSKTENTIDLASFCGGDGDKIRWIKEPMTYAGWRWLLSPATSRFDCFWVSPDLPGDTIDGRSSIPAILLNSVGMRRVLVLDEKIVVNQELTPAQRQKLRSGDADARKEIEPIDLRGRDLVGIQLNDAVLPRARFDQVTRLDNAALNGAQLQGSFIPGNILTWSQIKDAQLQGATFEGSLVFDETFLEGGDLSGAAFVRGGISGALFDKVVLNGARFDEVEWNNTILIDPVGIDSITGRSRYNTAENCLLITGTGTLPDPLLPNCSFIVSDPAASAAQPPTPKFWNGFWEAQMRRPCLAPSDVPPKEHFLDVYERLTNAVFAHEDMHTDMAQAAIAVATSDRCRPYFLRGAIEAVHQELAEEIKAATESDILPTTIRLNEAFYGAWLAELDRIEKASQPATTAP